MGEVSAAAEGDLGVGGDALGEDDEGFAGEGAGGRIDEAGERKIGGGAIGVEVEQHREVAGVRFGAAGAGDDEAGGCEGARREGREAASQHGIKGGGDAGEALGEEGVAEGIGRGCGGGRGGHGFVVSRLRAGGRDGGASGLNRAGAQSCGAEGRSRARLRWAPRLRGFGVEPFSAAVRQRFNSSNCLGDMRRRGTRLAASSMRRSHISVVTCSMGSQGVWCP